MSLPVIRADLRNELIFYVFYLAFRGYFEVTDLLSCTVDLDWMSFNLLIQRGIS